MFASVEELNKTLPEDRRLPAAADTRLIGEGGRLDSIGLVDLILSVEQGIQVAGGASITIADEKAFSRAQSPFLTLGTLTERTRRRCGGSSSRFARSTAGSMLW